MGGGNGNGVSVVRVEGEDGAEGEIDKVEGLV